MDPKHVAFEVVHGGIIACYNGNVPDIDKELQWYSDIRCDMNKAICLDQCVICFFMNRLVSAEDRSVCDTGCMKSVTSHIHASYIVPCPLGTGQ